MVILFIDSERQRDIQDWKTRLDIIANTRHAAVDGWLETQYEHLTKLAHNASLQVYLTELLNAPGPVDANDLSVAEAAYLRNLLVVAAEKSGFKGRVLGAQVNANVARTGVAGIALLDMQNNIVSATPSMPPLQGALADFAKGLEKGQRGLLDLHYGSAGTATC